ncbi:MAG TPA: TylF/MycF/NovP-related O-methyltransferase [Bryobacteraceae bacterium]|nr:TylF/MycF/NovP-related O-methyltransferase [Bryobacteraceae bacterium]
MKTLVLDRLRKWQQKFLARAGYVIFNTRSNHCYARDGLFTFNNDGFREDPGFKAAYERGVKASAGFDPRIEWRIHVALWVARTASRIPGDFVECGVNAGFTSSAIMQRLNWCSIDKTFYWIDTFNGPVLTQYSQMEVKLGRRRVAEQAVAREAYVTNLDLVRANYAEWPNVEIVQGAVPDVLPALGIERVAFLHLDMNCAYPERAALEHFWHLLSPCAMVLLDDYAYYGNEYLAQAIDSAASSLGTEVLSLPTGQGLIVK